MPWLELTVEADAEAVEAVSEILGRVTANGGTAVRPTRILRDAGDDLAVRADPAAPSLVTSHIADGPAAAAAIDATRRALWHLQAFGLREVGELQVTPVEDDWSERWREYYAPQRIGRIVIVPSWRDATPGEGEVVVRLDPGMAFGTGLHPTTRGCLTLLQALSPMPGRALDVGTGSGILALAALQLGADQVDGLDTDALAVDASRRNSALNGLEDGFAVRLGTLDDAPAQRYPLVMANLVASILIELAPRLAASTAAGGTLLAGGILTERVADVLAALSRVGFTVASRIHDEDWVSLHLTTASAA